MTRLLVILSLLLCVVSNAMLYFTAIHFIIWWSEPLGYAILGSAVLYTGMLVISFLHPITVTDSQERG